MDTIKTRVKDLEINYIKKGEGKKVLILPGWGTTINTYRTLINSISCYRTVYCLDMPGFGESEEPKKSWNVDDYVEFIIEFIESQKIEELDLIGHSNGGRIIIKLMSFKQSKFKVNKIILIGSAGIVNKKKFIKRVKIKLFKLGKKMFPNMATTFQNKFGSTDYKNATPVMRETLVKLVNEDLREYLSCINVPTLLLWGEKDDQTPISDGKLMEKLIPDSALIPIKDCTHYVFLEMAGYVNKIIYAFLKGE